MLSREPVLAKLNSWLLGSDSRSNIPRAQLRHAFDVGSDGAALLMVRGPLGTVELAVEGCIESKEVMASMEKNLKTLSAGMEVFDVEGVKVGKVDRVHPGTWPVEAYGHRTYEDVIETRTGMLGRGPRLYVPASAVETSPTEALSGYLSDVETFLVYGDRLDPVLLPMKQASRHSEPRQRFATNIGGR